MADISSVARWLRERDNYLILTHRRPDGDTIGCAVALCRALKNMGKTAWCLPNEDATALFTPYLDGTQAPEGFTPDFVISVDIASEGLFPDSAACYKGKVDLAIDHHPSQEYFAGETLVEADKAACGEILYRVICELTDMTPEIALPLYVALATDTGCFMYSNTSPNTHRIAADLMEQGIQSAWVNKRHFRTKTYTRLRLEGRIMENMQLCHGGRTAIGSISLADLADLGAKEEDLEDISAFIGQLEGVHTGVTVRETKPNVCKISVRTGDDLNATKVCGLLGGGGHAAAAGCTIEASVSEARKAILNAIETVMAQN